MNTFETLKENRFQLAFVPVYTALIYVVYSLVRHVPTGIAELFSGLLFIPLTAAGSLLTYYALTTFANETVSVVLISLLAVVALLRTLSRMAYFKKMEILAKKVTSSVGR